MTKLTGLKECSKNDHLIPEKIYVRCVASTKINKITGGVLKKSRIMHIGNMKQYYLLYMHDIFEVCPLIFSYFQFVNCNFLFIQVPPHYPSTTTNLLLCTNNNTSDMENKIINDQTITVRTEKKLIYSQVYVRKLCQYGKNGQDEEMLKRKLK